MNTHQARKILDAHKEGNYYNAKSVDAALQLLGDLQEGLGRPDQACKKAGLEAMGMGGSQMDGRRPIGAMEGDQKRLGGGHEWD
jgi:hypothetical protein